MINTWYFYNPKYVPGTWYVGARLLRVSRCVYVRFGGRHRQKTSRDIIRRHDTNKKNDKTHQKTSPPDIRKTSSGAIVTNIRTNRQKTPYEDIVRRHDQEIWSEDMIGRHDQKTWSEDMIRRHDQKTSPKDTVERRNHLNPFRTAVWFWGQLGANYMEFEWFVPKTGLEF